MSKQTDTVQAIPTDVIDAWIESMEFISDALRDVVHPDIRAHIVGLHADMISAKVNAAVVK